MVKKHGSVWGKNGEPDLDGVVGGLAIKVEVKRRGKEPTELQLSRLSEWRDAGAVATCVDNVDAFETLLRNAWLQVSATFPLYKG